MQLIKKRSNVEQQIKKIDKKQKNQGLVALNNIFFESVERSNFDEIKLKDYRNKNQFTTSLHKKNYNLQTIKERQEKYLISNLQKNTLNPCQLYKTVSQGTFPKGQLKPLRSIDLREAYENYRKRNNLTSQLPKRNNDKKNSPKIVNQEFMKGIQQQNNDQKIESETISIDKKLKEKQKQKFKEKCIGLLQKNRNNNDIEQKKYEQIIEQLKNPTRIHQIQQSSKICNPPIKEGQQIKQIKRIRENFEKQQCIKILSYKPKFSQRKHTSYTKSARIVSAPRYFTKSISTFQTTNSNRIIEQPNTTIQNQIKKKIVSKMIFRLNEFSSDKTYKKKIESYLQFLYKVNFSNNIYVDLNIKNESQSYTKYKVYIGKGNNSLLIKGLLKRRFWFQIVASPNQQVNFYWTQLKLKDVHQKQTQFKKQIITKTKQIKSNKKLKVQQNLKIMNKLDALFIQPYLMSYSIRTSIYDKYKSNIMTNHIPQNSFIGSKKALFHSLYYYYRYCLNINPFNFIPQTFHVKGPEDPSYKQFCKISKSQDNKVWILKPGQNSNRGNGICLIYTKQIHSKISKKQYHQNGQLKTYIIQSYINKPFLFNNRKFDIRHYMLITSVNGIMKGFWYEQGYIRTSSYSYNLDDLDNNLVHLTNDAVQKYGHNYGKYQAGNKLSYNEFQRYLDMHHTVKKYSFQNEILPKMKSIALDAIKANFRNMDKKRRENNFQVFGLDFMIDHKFKPWLIQINSNPCLQISCPLLSRIIPGMIQNTLRIALDPLFPPLTHFPSINRYDLSDNILSNLKYQLFFDEKMERQELIELFSKAQQAPQQIFEVSDHEEQQYQDQGQQVQIKI